MRGDCPGLVLALAGILTAVAIIQPVFKDRVGLNSLPDDDTNVSIPAASPASALIVWDEQGNVYSIGDPSTSSPKLNWKIKLPTSGYMISGWETLAGGYSDEIVAMGGDGSIYSLNAGDGSIRWEYTQPWTPFPGPSGWRGTFGESLAIYGAPYFEDVDGDSDTELVVGINVDSPGNGNCGCSGGGVIVLEKDGTEKNSLRYTMPISNGWNGNGPTALAMEDVNSDGVRDAIVMIGSNLYPSLQPRIIVIDLTKSAPVVIKDFTGGNSGSGMTSTSVGDFDGDNAPDFATAGWWGSSPAVTYANNGSVLWSRAFSGGDADRSVSYSPDVDGAGTQVLFVGTSSYGEYRSLQLYFANPSTGADMVSPFVHMGSARMLVTLGIGDIDGNPGQELLVLASSTTGPDTIYVLSAKTGASLADGNGDTYFPHLLDSDSDGVGEVYTGIGSGVNRLTSGLGIAWNFPLDSPLMGLGLASAAGFTADAGPDQTVNEGDTVTFNGSATSGTGVLVKGASNPILEAGPSGSWDDYTVLDPYVLKADGMYKMWYFSARTSDLYHWKIGYAESPDGMTWSKHTDPVLAPDSSNPWESSGVLHPSVLRNATGYQMWYAGEYDWSGTQLRIGYAVSANGIDWTRPKPNPVLGPGNPGEWDGVATFAPVVIYDSGTYHMWYNGRSGTYDASIGYAWSPDGITWNRHPSNPVLEYGPEDSWADGRVHLASVVRVGGTFLLFYGGHSPSQGIGVATSTDGINWTKSPKNPVLKVGPASSWDDAGLLYGTVLTESGRFRMWFGGSDGSGGWTARVGHAVSSDGFSWIERAVNPVLQPGPGSYDAGSVDSPFVTKVGGSFWMYYMGHSGSVGELALATSSDGIEWVKSTENPVLPTNTSSWDACQISNAVVVPGAPWRMWYTGWVNCGDFGRRIGYATSSDGVHWTKYPTWVMGFGSPGDWDDTHVSVGSVLWDSTLNLWRMWYVGWSDGLTSQIGYVESVDGLVWTSRRALVLPLGAQGSWDNLYVTSPSVLKTGTGFEMWFLGADSSSTGIGHATSTDGINWTESAGNPVLRSGPSHCWDAGPLGGLSALRDQSALRMWFRGADISGKHFSIGYSSAESGGNFSFSWDFDANVDSDGDGNYVNDVDAVGQSPTHVYGDNGVYTVTLTVRDSLNRTESDTMRVTVLNVAPSIRPFGPYTAAEGGQIAAAADAVDPGSDDLRFNWSFDWGPTVQHVHYNDGIGTDPYPSPWGNFPFTAADNVSHTYGDNGVFGISLRVEDDDGGVAFYNTTVTVANVLPSGTLTILTTDQHEGSPIQFSARVTDPGSDDIFFRWAWGYGAPDEYSTYYNNRIGPDPYPSPDVNPRNITDVKSHTYGDNGAFTVTVFVRDDDSGANGITLKVTVTPDNLPPSVTVSGGMNIDEGQSVSLTANATDPGSDDLTFTWDWGEGSTSSKTYYNDGVGPDPSQSPGGTFPFTATDNESHPYGDNGLYMITLTVTDDDGGSVTWSGQAVVNNLPPTIQPFGPFAVDEAGLLSVNANAVDPGSDDLSFTWTFEYGPTMQNVHYNDGIGPDPPKSPWGTYPFSVDDAVSHTYGDNGIFRISLAVEDDDGGVSTYETSVTVNNIPPAIVEVRAFMLADITLRVAGEKWHDVILKLYEEGREVARAQVVRYPGSPDDQAVTIQGIEIPLDRRFSAVAYYTPDDDPINGQTNGANPAWLKIRWEAGSETVLQHNFNVMHQDTWTWTVDDFYTHAVNQIVHLRGMAHDVGSDDLTFTWDSGDGRTFTQVFYNNGIGPDPYPSPDVNPITATHEVELIYHSPGTYTVTLVVADDDLGLATYSFALRIS